jgi:hypothetical protein
MCLLDYSKGEDYKDDFFKITLFDREEWMNSLMKDLN